MNNQTTTSQDEHIDGVKRGIIYSFLDIVKMNKAGTGQVQNAPKYPYRALI